MTHFNDPMLDVFLFETTQQMEHLEQTIMNSETCGAYSSDSINEIFRIMHTIKSSAAMMLFPTISTIAHTSEDLFYYLREKKPTLVDSTLLCDLNLETTDFIKAELTKIKEGKEADGDGQAIINKTIRVLADLREANGKDIVAKVNDTKKQFYISSTKHHPKKHIFKATIHFQDDCEMENIRAYAVIRRLKDITEDFHYSPHELIDDEDSIPTIRRHGFIVYFKTDQNESYMTLFFQEFGSVEQVSLIGLENDQAYEQAKKSNEIFNSKTSSSASGQIPLMESEEKESNSIRLHKPNIIDLETRNFMDDRVMEKEHDNDNESELELSGSIATYQNSNIIGVNVEKLDKLMDLVGEMVIAEAMVLENPDLKGLQLDQFEKASQQLRKITDELQDTAMSMRMVPLGPTFLKMNRIVRDMSKKLGKEIHLDILGEDTEVDKNIMEHIGDPLMHIVKNSIDHGIEPARERQRRRKPAAGTITIEAKHVGNEVLVIVRDDGAGLNREKILQKAINNDLIQRASKFDE